MDIWIKAAQFILSLSLLVILHEFGHFIPAKLFKTRVEKFYLFFNPWFSLFKKKVGDTEWGIGWLPLGGFVKISGMVDESMDKEQLAQPAQPWEFRSKPAWQRLIIMLGGVFVNVVVGFVIYIGVVLYFGEDRINPNDLKDGMAVHPILSKYGLNSGDVIIALDDKKVNNITEINIELFLRGKRKITVKHKNGKIENIILPNEIDRFIFENSAFNSFSIRQESTTIKGFAALNKLELKKKSIKTGDLLLSINDHKLTDTNDIRALLTSKKPISIQWLNGNDTLKDIVPSQNIQALKKVFPLVLNNLKVNDKIIAVNNVDIKYYDELYNYLYNNRGGKINVKIQRGDQILFQDLDVTKEATLGYIKDTTGFIDKNAVKHYNFSFGESINVGVHKAYNSLHDYIVQMKYIFTSKGASSLGGFASMGNMFSSTWDWEDFWLKTAWISLALAFMNLLPIPALDGGHVVFLLYEMITGKEAPQKVLEIAQYVGIVLLLSLMLYANGNDVYRIFFK